MLDLVRDQIWTPPNVIYLGSIEVGFNQVTGESILSHLFTSLSPVTGNDLPYTIILSPASESLALIEEQMGNANEASIRQESEKEVLRPPTEKEHKDDGKELEERRVTTARMKESSNNKIYY